MKTGYQILKLKETITTDNIPVKVDGIYEQLESFYGGLLIIEELKLQDETFFNIAPVVFKAGGMFTFSLINGTSIYKVTINDDDNVTCNVLELSVTA